MYLKKTGTILETASEGVPGFKELAFSLERSFAINGKATSTLRNYLRCLAHLALHYKCSPELLDEERINDYLYHCQNLHDTPSESFFKHTVYGLRAAYKAVSYTHLRAHETDSYLVCRLL